MLILSFKKILEELMELDGIYTKLVKAQEISQLDEDYGNFKIDF